LPEERIRAYSHALLLLPAAQFREVPQMVVITLTDQDIVRLEMILVDHDQSEALLFLRDRILPEIKKRQEGKCDPKSGERHTV